MSSIPAQKLNSMIDSERSNPGRTLDYLESESDLIRQYYDQVHVEDLENRTLDELNAAAMSHWNFAASRMPGDCLVRIYNPVRQQHGWESTHTIVEIVTDDKPFLVRTVSLVIARLGFAINQLIHPIFTVARKPDGTLNGLVRGDADGASLESFMQLHIDRLFDESDFHPVETALRNAVANVNLVCDDWEPMKNASQASNEKLKASATDDFSTSEACDFVDWLQRYHFTFTGYCEVSNTHEEWQIVEGSAFGIFRSEDAQQRLDHCLPGTELRNTSDDLLYITKSIEPAPVIWPRPMDIVTYRRVDRNGNVSGRCVICGFFTSRADSTDLDSIPILRHKLRNIVARSSFNPGAHDGKLLLTILEDFPRDLLLQTDESTVADIACGTMNLLHYPQVRLFAIEDRFKRMATCFVYMPSDSYSRELRLRIQSILQDSLRADNVEFDITLSSEDTLARMVFSLRTPGIQSDSVETDFATIELPYS